MYNKRQNKIFGGSSDTLKIYGKKGKVSNKCFERDSFDHSQIT